MLTAEQYEKRLMAGIVRQDLAIQQMIGEFINRVSPHLAKYRNVKKAQIWYRNSTIEKAIEKELLSLQSRLQGYMISEGSAAWNLAAEKTDAMVEHYLRGFPSKTASGISYMKNELPINALVREGYFSRNLDALKTFQNRRVGNMGLSDRVWDVCDQAKTNLEYYLQSGVGTGRSAAEISRDVRGLLQDPDKRFRRIRDADGKLKPSAPMKAYHPGQGKYRSAYKNALRMTRTETNMAYRMSDQVRWQKIDFVVGYEVKLSGSHPEVDICDSMVGKYPKTFVFYGWHSNCYCYAVPVMLDQDQFVDYLFTEKIPGGAQIQKIPSAAAGFIKDNSDKLRKYATPPYWLKDNFTLKNGSYVPRKGIAKLPPGAALQAGFKPEK